MAALAESELPSAGRGATLAWRLAGDDALVRATARGHDGAFAALFDRYHAPLVRYCRSMLLDGDDAQDAAQNALTSALRALRGDRTPPLHLRPWLYRIAHNEALAIARRRPPVIAGGLDEEAAALAAPDDRDAREAFRELLADLRTLPERQRSALVLRELEGLSYPDVAGALALSPEAARQAVFEARAALLAHRDGRAADCADVQRRLSEGDGRTARSRDLRAHLDSCGACTAFAADIKQRRRALRALFPLPGILAVGSGGGWALAGLGGAGVAAKCAALCATAVVLGGSVAAIESTRHLHHGGGIVSATAGPTPRALTARHATPAPAARTARTPPARAAASTARRVTVRPARAVQTQRAAKGHARTSVAHLPASAAPAPAPAPAATTPQQPVAPPTQQAAATLAATTPDLAAQRRQQLAASLAAAREAVRQSVTTAQTQTAQILSAMQQSTSTAITSTQQQLAALRDRVKAALPGQATTTVPAGE